MTGTLIPRPSDAAAVEGSGNQYKTVQARLARFGRALDAATFKLEELHKGMRSNADRAETLAGSIERAGLDPRFVAMTDAVSQALGGAAVQIRKVDQEAREAAGLAHDAQRTHARLYEALDTVRSGRPEATPKPGFFAQ